MQTDFMITVKDLSRKYAFEAPAYLIAAVTLLALLACFAPMLLIFPIAVALFVYFWNHKVNLVLFLLIYTPFEEIILKSISASFYAPMRYIWESMLLTMMILMILENLMLGKSWKKSPIDLMALAFVGFWFISGFVNSKPLTASLINIKNLVRYIPVFYIIYNSRPDVKLISRFLNILIIIAVFESLLCIAQAIEGNKLVEFFRPTDVIIDGKLSNDRYISVETHYTQFSGSLGRSNHLGNYLAFGICFLAAAFIRFRKNGVLVLSLLLISAGLFLSSSRISWISAFVGVGFILFNCKHRLRYPYIIIPVLILFVVLSNLTSRDLNNTSDKFDIVGRFYQVFTRDYFDVSRDTGRLYAILEAAPAVLGYSPILGLGPGSFMRISEQISDDMAYADSEKLDLEPAALNYVHDVGYVALLVQSGLAGLLTIAALFLRLNLKASRSSDSEKNPLIGAFMLGSLGFFVSVAIQNIATFNLTYRNEALIIWFVCGLVASFSTIANEQFTQIPSIRTFKII